jgi:pyruvate/2-oxoglutarate dehydrogenase complex dihydrolipoamide dehydrogenase (E3) component
MAERWRRPRRFDRNLIVIGAGSAGLVAALVAARLGAKVTLVEAGAMGGDCLNTGCVPSKALIHAAGLVARARAAERMGLLGPAGTADSAAAFRHVRAAIAAVAPHDSVERYRALGVDVRLGRARITSPWTVAIDGAELSAHAIVIASGAEPVVPDIPGLAASGFLTSETLWRLDRAPPRLAILGGGPVGCELAQAFARLGSAVTLVERGPRLLAREDDVVADAARARLEAEGVRVHTGAAVASVVPGELRWMDQAPPPFDTLLFDTLLVAVGRRARTAGLGLEALGIRLTESGTIAVNAYLQTRFRHIYACGDAAGPFQYTHAAGQQGWHAAVNALFSGLPRLRPDHRLVPAVTFMDPEIARVGITEREAIAEKIPFAVTRHDLAELDRAIVDGARDGFVRVLTAPGRDRVLGATIVAPRAGEMLAEVALAMRHGLGLKALFGALRAYPTYSEAVGATAGRWREANAPAWALPWLARFLAWRRG